MASFRPKDYVLTISPFFEPASDNNFAVSITVIDSMGIPGPVDMGGIDKVTAAMSKPIHECVGRGYIDARSELRSPETEL